MIGACRNCKRIVAYDEKKCPFCGIEKPMELPWGVARFSRRGKWPRAFRRWVTLVAAVLLVLFGVVLCSAAPGAPTAAEPDAGVAPPRRGQDRA